MKKFYWSLLTLSFLCTQLLQAQKTFYGTVDYSYEFKGEQAAMMALMMPTKMTVQYAKEGMATKMEGGMLSAMMGKIIVNIKDNETFVVKDDEQTVYVMNAQDLDSESKGETSKIEKIGDKRKILNYNCVNYKIVTSQNGQQVVQIVWITDELETPKIEVPGMKKMGNDLMNLPSLPGFPMRSEVEVPEAQISLVLEATNITKEKIDPVHFKRPASYQVKDFSEMLQGFGN